MLIHTAHVILFPGYEEFELFCGCIFEQKNIYSNSRQIQEHSYTKQTDTKTEASKLVIQFLAFH